MPKKVSRRGLLLILLFAFISFHGAYVSYSAVPKVGGLAALHEILFLFIGVCAVVLFFVYSRK